MTITFAASRGNTEVRLLQKKVQQILDAAIEALVNASCKSLRRRVGQRLRKKLGKVLHQEEFEQALVIFCQREAELLLAEAPLTKDSQEYRDSAAHSPCSSTDSGSFSRQTTLDPALTNNTIAGCNILPCQHVNTIPAPVVTGPYFVAVLAAPSGATTQQLVRHAASDSPASSADSPGTDLRSCSRTTKDAACSLSPVDDEDIADLSMDWIRTVCGGGPAPVERTFIQFKTKLRVNHKRSKSS